MSLAKRKYISSDIGILYPTLKFSNQNLNFKLRWRKISPLAPWNYFCFGTNLYLPWDWRFYPSDYSLLSPLEFIILLLY